MIMQASEKPGKITKVGYLPVNVRMHAMEHPKYGIPKNGDEPYLFNTIDEKDFNMWENAKVVPI